MPLALFSQTSRMFPYPTLVPAPSPKGTQYLSLLWIFFQLPIQGFLARKVVEGRQREQEFLFSDSL